MVKNPVHGARVSIWLMRFVSPSEGGGPLVHGLAKHSA
jgi:hypothetical protein